ncbi:hypothetical protein ACFL3Z_01405 [Gemmatimonadota bacterium]
MLRKLASLTLLTALLAPTGLGAQTEIPGTVTGVEGRDVTIQIPGDLLPRQGDEVRLRFRDPVEGVGLVFLEGTWEVSVVRRDEVVAAPPRRDGPTPGGGGGPDLLGESPVQG